jgi:DNA-directed RNA polymerase alpha subunit
MEIKDLEISTRTYKALKAAGIETLSQLQSLRRQDIGKIPGIGKLSRREILDELAIHRADTSSSNSPQVTHGDENDSDLCSP